ncbi:MAG TPA: GAF domain-containing protein [Candidatus Limnocylindrales bacterium]|nr:GAF domain-containing protein [Candidatus Limnocylindrales bacterium]
MTKAARLLGVHPNTIRAWSDQGRLRYYRINPRGDRRYRLGDLQRFLSAAAAGTPAPAAVRGGRPRRGGSPNQPPALTVLGPGRATRDWPARRTPGGRSALAATLGPAETSDDRRRHTLDMAVIAELSQLGSPGRDLDLTLGRAVHLIRTSYGHAAVAVLEWQDTSLEIRAVEGSALAHGTNRPAAIGASGRALDENRAILVERGRSLARPDGPILPESRVEIVAPIPGDRRAWGLLVIGSEMAEGLTDLDLATVASLAGVLGGLVARARLLEETSQQVHRLEALHRVAGDIGSKLDLDQILAGIVDHAMVLFAAERSAVFLRRPDGTIGAEVARGLSAGYVASVRDFPTPSLPAAAVAARAPMFAVHYADDPLGVTMRPAVIQEGFDTMCAAPFFDGDSLLGLLCVYHDRPHQWTPDELETIGAFAAQGSVAIKTAQNYAQMATWAAQLQSIQALGTRLNRLGTVEEIGSAIAIELRDLIDYHNVRVYRIRDGELIPVAFHGQVGEYSIETGDMLRVPVGTGITGWVAVHGIAQILPDASNDPRATTIPGTDEDLDESMLLAPMTFEDEVLGVVVLSKLGLHQFDEDDLRLLVIYASLAAQAMANADTTSRLRSQTAALERQLESQRALLLITESILTTLDPTAVLDQVTNRLADLVRYDNISVELVDPLTHLLTPFVAKGVHAGSFMEPWEPDETGIGPWVVEHGEPVLIEDEKSDPRVNHFRETGPLDGSLIVVPLRDRGGAHGVLTLERLGRGDVYTADEFELVKLFAAQVSIALQNAEVYRRVEIRARSDALTGLLNHGTFQEILAQKVRDHEACSLIMLDLDDFRTVNNTLGHQAGDRLLKAIAESLEKAGRAGDQVFRYGGDEFAYLLPGTDGSGALLVANRVRTAVAEVGKDPRWADSGAVISASIGVATFPADGETAESVLLAADRACFVAKRTGRARIATAAEGLALAAEFSLQEPTPVDSPSLAVD